MAEDAACAGITMWRLTESHDEENLVGHQRPGRHRLGRSRARPGAGGRADEGWQRPRGRFQSNVRTGNFVYFDNSRHMIGPEHVMASGSLPPGFPAVEIEGE